MLLVAAPHDFHPDLSPERLSVLHQTVARARTFAFSTLAARPAYSWSAGCLAYEESLNAFEQLAAETSWLRFFREGLAYTLLLGVVPIRVQGANQKPKYVTTAEAVTLARPSCQQLLPLGDFALTLDACSLRLEFEMEGARIGACALRVYSRSEKNQVLYHSWDVYLPDAFAVAVAPVAHLPRRDAEELAPADFGLASQSEDGKELSGRDGSR